MEWALFALLVSSAVLLASSLAALPDRSCSNTLNLCTQDSRAVSLPNDCVFVDADPAVKCNTISVYLHLEQTKAIVPADDCLQVNVYPGTYTLSLYTSILNYSAVISAPVGGVSVTCQSECMSMTELTTGSPLWFQRNATSSPEVGEFFVQLEGISFEGFLRPLQFDAMDYVGISNCTFTNFTSSAIDAFNCQRVQVESSLFHNCNASMEKEQYRANSGGLSIAYHTNETVYYNSTLPPWIHVTDCVFTQNRVLLPGENTQQQIDQALNNHFYFGRGGGFGIFLDEFFINITVIIESCRFEDNYADSFGGGLYLYLDGTDTQHNFTVRDCNFTGNSAGAGSFGGGLQVALLLRNADSDPSRLYFIRCNFVRNEASFGGGMSTVQVYSQGSGNVVSLSDSYFEGNSANDVGSAVMFASLLYVQNRNASYHYQVYNNTFFNNMSPGGVFGAGFIHQDLYGHNQFLNNTGPGLRIVGSQVTVRGNLSFIGNDAQNFEGGAVYISAFGQIKLYRGAEIHFIENIGRIGSAIVVDVQRSSVAFSQLIFNTQCFLIFENATTPPDEWDQVTVRFSGNSAQVAPVVYISHLSLCSWFSVTRVSNDTNQIEASFSATNFTLWPVFDYSSADNMAHSQPDPRSVQYYFQTEARAVSSDITEEPMAVYPGQSTQLNLVGLDLFENPTYFIARISDSRADINSGAFSQATDDDLNITTNADDAVDFEPALIPIQPGNRTVPVLYRVPSSTLPDLQEGDVIRVVVDTPYNVRDSQRFNFSLSFTFCLPGYELSGRAGGEDGLLTCTCLDSTFNILACDSGNNVIVLRDGLWASTSGESNPQLEVHTCPAPYCQCDDTNNITCDNLYYHDDPDYNRQCHSLRTGTLCGQCVNGTSVGVLRFNCRECSTEYYWTLGFLVIGDVLVCVVILVGLVKLHYTFPHSMKGFLFYTQTVYYATAYFPASFWDARKYMLYISSAVGLYFPWDFCLFPGMSALTSFPPRFVPATVATIVAIASLISVFHFFEKRAQKRIWHGLWAFVLLLYAPLVYNCTILLHCPVLPSAEGGETVPRWFLDGEVECFRDGGHIVLGLIAILLLTLLSLMLPALFIFTLIGNSPRLQAYPLAERLYGALSAGYHERARWWGVWDLARRLLLIGIVVALPGRSVAGLYIIIPALAAHLFFLPYLKWWQNLLEALVLMNYILLLLLRSTQTILDDLVSYSGTTVPQSQGSDLAEPDALTALFSFWYYLPLVMAVTAAVLTGVRAIVIYVQRKRERTSTFDVGESYANYDSAIAASANKNVTVTHVSIS